MQQAHFVDRHNAGFERRDSWPVQQFAGDAVFGQQRLFQFRRGDAVSAPRLQPAGLADAMPGAGLDDPFAMQLQRFTDQPVQGRRPRPETSAGRVGQEARDPSGVLQRPNRIPAQGRMAVGQIFRQ